MDTTKPHHTEDGFRNNYPSGWKRGSFWKWQRERWAKGLPRTPDGGWHFPLVHPDVAWIRANRDDPALTWIGHATFLLQLDGLNILTDPHLTGRASPLSFAGPERIVPPALGFHDLPHIDAVVVSHNHYDHLDAGTVERLARQAGGPPRFFVPLGLKAWFAAQGIRDDVVELDWWDETELGGVTFTFTPVQHWSARTPWDRNRTLWGGWRIDAGEASVFFAGDTGYSQDFKDIRARLGPVDYALLPIGAYEPRWFMSVMHVNPEEAVKIHEDLEAGHSVAMHWGTFVLTDEPMDEPPRKLVQALRREGIPHERFWLLKHGETRRLDQPMAETVAVSGGDATAADVR
ncbi:MAG: MBL fold metallo-hydrolase [Betaproteobacteria bacterium]|nr:MBL fold metallo-hydrolase [Betaproteobacteria bacterium]